MLRRASVEKASVTEVSEEYGVSRPTYYQAKADFDESGIAEVVPRKRGPRGPHKIQGEVSAFLRAQISPGEPIRARELAKSLQKEFGLDVHPRTIERAVGEKQRRVERGVGSASEESCSSHECDQAFAPPQRLEWPRDLAHLVSR